jgi:hypothetical protein
MSKPKNSGSPSEWADIRHFKPVDFSCKCGTCTGVPISLDLVRKLDHIQEAIGLPLHVNFGVRCKAAQNKRNGGPSYSPHVPHGEAMVATAADIMCPNKEFRFKVLEAAFPMGISGIGIGPNYLHLEVDHPDGKACWVYEGKAAARKAAQGTRR